MFNKNLFRHFKIFVLLILFLSTIHDLNGQIKLLSVKTSDCNNSYDAYGFKAIYKQTSYDGTVNLILKGQMLRSMSASTVGSNAVKVTFNSNEMTQRAMYNIEKGRNFFGITDKEIQDNKLFDMLLEGLTVELK